MSYGNGQENAASDDTPAIDPLPHQHGLGAAGKGTLASVVALVSAAYPPAAIPLAGMGAALQAVGERLNILQQIRTAELLTAASRESSRSIEDVVEELIERDELVLLVAEAVDSARRTRLPGKARALGESLGSILADDALFDLESVWIRIIGVVEPPHIRILGMFLEPTATMGTGSKLLGTGPILKVSDIGDRLGLQEAVLPLIEDLTRSGLLMNPGAEGMETEEEGIYNLPPDAFGQPVKATTLGAQLFARLSVAGLPESN